MVERILVDLARPDWVVESLVGVRPDARHYTRVVGEGDADVIKPDGTLLLAYRRRRITSAAARHAWGALLRAATPTDRRTDAAAGERTIRSGWAGYTGGKPAAFTRKDKEGWRCVQPLLRALSEEFRKAAFLHYEAQQALLEETPGVRIPGTVFTTVTANSTVQMGVHRDGGNLPGAMGVMTVIESGKYAGGLLVFPKYEVAVDLRSCDLLVCDNREAHGNTEMVGVDGMPFVRVSVVAYCHKSNLRSK